MRTRQRIIIAAAEVVNESTFDKAGLVDIAARAGVTTGAFYFYFDNKEDIAHAVIESQNAYSQRKATKIVDEGHSLIETLLRVSADFTYDILEDPLVRAGARLTSEVLALSRPPLQPFTEWVAFNTHLLDVGRNENVIDRDLNTHNAAEFIVGSFTGHYLLSTLLHDLAGLPRRILTMWELFLDAAAVTPDTWKERAHDLFLGRPAPQPLNIEQATERHLATAHLL
ncbi:TetR/AcrR family transcriptional regulator [Microbacterium rhizomatis]|uniref:TetR/AcrR family transcriptional regulator n=1 Tax=Microbacterium rhizomatis TaxID=1631477 RepID=UPI0014780ABE|nr:TetR/AcrR family transcriptional regulator [Microbacterium rhizomatis]